MFRKPTQLIPNGEIERNSSSDERKLYNFLNESKSKPVTLNHDLNDELTAYFKPKNLELKKLLEKHGACKSFPPWL